MELVSLADGMRREGRLLSGARIDSPPRFFIGVADVPLSPGYTFDRLEEKSEAGADFVQTQIVFDVEAFESWAESARARGIFERMFVLVGVAVPDRVIELLEEAGPDAEAEGVRLTVEVVAKLKAIQGIAGIHVMGLGRMDPVRHVIESSGLMPRPGLP